MKRSKFSDTQIVSILKQVEAGMPVKEVCRRHQISLLLQMEVEVRRIECFRTSAQSGTGSRKQQAQTHVCRDGDGKSRIERSL